MGRPVETFAVVVDTQLTGTDALSVCRALTQRRLPAEIRCVALHLSRVESVDASGVAALVRLHSQLAVTGRQLKLVSVRPGVEARLLGLGLSELITIEEPPADGGAWARRPVITLP